MSSDSPNGDEVQLSWIKTFPYSLLAQLSSTMCINLCNLGLPFQRISWNKHFHFFHSPLNQPLTSHERRRQLGFSAWCITTAMISYSASQPLLSTTVAWISFMAIAPAGNIIYADIINAAGWRENLLGLSISREAGDSQEDERTHLGTGTGISLSSFRFFLQDIRFNCTSPPFGKSVENVD